MEVYDRVLYYGIINVSLLFYIETNVMDSHLRYSDHKYEVVLFEKKTKLFGYNGRDVEMMINHPTLVCHVTFFNMFSMWPCMTIRNPNPHKSDSNPNPTPN